jgi:hypothetical protein
MDQRVDLLFGWALTLADLHERMTVGAGLTLAGIVVLAAATPALWREAKKGTFPPLRLKLALLAGTVLLSFGAFIFASGYYRF